MSWRDPLDAGIAELIAENPEALAGTALGVHVHTPWEHITRSSRTGQMVRGRVASHGEGVVMLEFGGNHFAGSFSRMVAADAGLDVALEFFEGGADTCAVSFADLLSAALGLNNQGQMVGISLDANFNPRATLWQNGNDQATDLNTLIPPNSSLFLIQACGINSLGQIIGLAMQTSTGDFHGYLLTPMPTERVLPAASQRKFKTTKVPENVRELLQQRLSFGPFGARPVRPQ